MTFEPSNWKTPQRPTNAPIIGRYAAIAPWDRHLHGAALWDAFGKSEVNELLFHFGWPQMNQWEDLADILDDFNQSGSFVTCVFMDNVSNTAQGMASYMAIVPEHGRVETGAVAHGKAVRKNRAATEAHYLMARRVFDELGYRRYEWKLNNPNQASHYAAQRFGFTFEGIFRQHQVMRYGNRDTAWYSMLDHEWPRIKAAFEAWLDPDNFDDAGQQRKSLASLRQTMTAP